MRFSSIFSPPLAPQPAVRTEVARTAELPLRAPAHPVLTELPDDLDQRVRLVGEWQLGEAA